MIKNERGIAMAICLFVLAALSGLTVAALFRTWYFAP